MTKSLLLIALAMLLSQTVDAQVKRKYKDEKHKQETVVIKDNKEVSDIDVLNSQFDIDDIAVGQVIRITTENIPKDTLSQIPMAEVPVQQPEQKTVLAIITKPKEAAKPIVEISAETKKTTSPAKKKSAKSKKAKSTYKPGRAKTQKLGKFKNKKYSFSKRKKKKKRVGSNKKTCYNF